MSSLSNKLFGGIALCSALFLAACNDSGPAGTLKTAATAITNHDSGGFLATIDMKAYAANEYKAMQKDNDLLNTVNSFSSMLGIQTETNDFLQSMMDLENTCTKKFVDGISSGELAEQCARSEKGDCPWSPEALSNAEVKNLSPDTAVAKVVTPNHKTSWVSLKKKNDTWYIVGHAMLEQTAAAYTRSEAKKDMSGQPQPKQQPQEQPAAPSKKPAQQGGVQI